MKTRFIFTVLCVSSLLFQTKAQLKVFANGTVQTYNQTCVRSNSSNPTDGLDIINTNTSLSPGTDLIWGYYYTTQPNNPGLLTLQSLDGACFSVRNDGKVGIYNHDPSVALEIGTNGSNEQVKVNGTIVLGSDERIKENIKDLSNSTDKLKLLHSVSYTFKTKENINSKDSILVGGIRKPIFYAKSNPAYKDRNHYGFLAQEVEKVFPDLVYKDSAGMLGVDYIGMIPIIVNTLKEQKVQLDTQAAQIAELTDLLTKLNNSGLKKVGASPTTDITETNVLSYPVLDQNVPNPFNTSTTIGYYLPTTIINAFIYVYDMNGVQLKSYAITGKGKGNIAIQGSEFNAGMYLYALIVDGKVIDTKRMILTK